MIFELVDKNNEILHRPLKKFDWDNPVMDPIELAKSLAETMLKYNGIGLAANQIGVDARVFAIKTNPIIVCFNPVVVNQSKEEIYLEEGCLTYPGYYVKIKRSKVIKMRYSEPNRNIVTQTFDGLTSRIVQHELTHLDGKVFYKDADLFHRGQADRAYKKWVRENSA